MPERVEETEVSLAAVDNQLDRRHVEGVRLLLPSVVPRTSVSTEAPVRHKTPAGGRKAVVIGWLLSLS